MTTDSLTSIDHLEQELTELQSELQGGLRLLAALNEIPGEFALLNDQLATTSAAMSAATVDAQRQVLAHESAGAEQQRKFTQITEELTARTAQVDAQWQAFHDAMELERSQFTQQAATIHQELFNRAAEQENLVGSLNERLETMNQSLANMVSDLGAARRYQARLGLLLAAMILLSLGLSATALWYALR